MAPTRVHAASCSSSLCNGTLRFIGFNWHFIGFYVFLLSLMLFLNGVASLVTYDGAALLRLHPPVDVAGAASWEPHGWRCCLDCPCALSHQAVMCRPSLRPSSRRKHRRRRGKRVNLAGCEGELAPRHGQSARGSRQSGVCWENLRSVTGSELKETVPVRDPGAAAPPQTRFGLVNARSVLNKTFILRDVFSQHGLTFLCICESWIPFGDSSALLELVPPGCSCFNIPRSRGRGGGLVVVLKSNFPFKQLTPTMSFSSFELCLFELCISPRLLVVLIYRPPKTDSNFLNDLCDLVADCILKYDYVLYFDDFNIHICCPDDVLAKGFLNLLDSFNITQWVSSPTYARGHTLDLVLSFGLPVMNLVTLPPVFSDHSPILCDVTLPCPVPVCEAPATRFRGLDAETVSKFVDCMSVRLETFNPDPSNVDHYSQHFDLLCNQVLVAPLKLCKSRPGREPWFSDVTRVCRRACRSSERKWKKDGLQVSRDLFRASLVAYQDAVRAARTAYFASSKQTPRIPGRSTKH
ncbi:uncharacterized protein [Nothobranchius furzeri]|uniref:uncharacterized protein n=1 Tax=Nothobranchius furzeri TaxID=105023 RepID=UPI003904C3CE